MKNRSLFFCVFFYAMFVILQTGCYSSLHLPSTEESETKIAALQPEIDSLDSMITSKTLALPKGFDIVSRTKLTAINRLLNWAATIDVRDIHIDFTQTRPLWKEDKTILGVSYSNYVDIDTGALEIDMKKFRFTNFTNNIVNAEIEIEGMGTIRASGKYSGIPVAISPQVHFYMNEQLQFAITVADSDNILLTPLPKTLLLKTKITLPLLGLNIPYYKEIPLQAEKLLKSVVVPSALRSEIVFPIPASHYGEQRLEFVHRFLSFTKTTVNARHDILEFRGNADFEK